MKGRWVKDYCPFAKDQGFYSVIGNVTPGEKIFGFTHLQVAAGDTIVLATETSGLVTEMLDKNYRVLLTKADSGSISAANVGYVRAKTKVGFVLDSEAGKYVDVIVIGRVLN